MVVVPHEAVRRLPPSWRVAVASARCPAAVAALALAEAGHTAPATRWASAVAQPYSMVDYYPTEVVRDVAGAASHSLRSLAETLPERIAPAGAPPVEVVHGPIRVAAAWAGEEVGRALLMGRPVCPAYPLAPWRYAAAVTAGMSPADVSGGLTHGEAHAWLSEGGDVDPGTWLLRRRAGIDAVCRAPVVARWVLACLEDARAGALRSLVLPHLDLVQASDVRSMGDGVRAVLLRGEMRRARGAHGMAPVPPWMRGRHLPCVRHLRTADELVAEGARMSHCVGQYASEAVAGRSVILSVVVVDGAGKAHASTAELDARGRLVQHQGRANSDPPTLCVRALRLQLAEWGLHPRGRACAD